MIKFQGEISQECRKYLANWETLGGKIAGLTVGALCCVAVILLAIYWNVYILIALIGCLAIMVFGGWSPGGIEKRAPKSITIENGIIEMTSDTQEDSRDLDTVKKVKDYGEWYVIEFLLSHKSGYFICQKNLIVEGSIEEFEKLFEGKIVRKYK